MSKRSSKIPPFLVGKSTSPFLVNITFRSRQGFIDETVDFFDNLDEARSFIKKVIESFQKFPSGRNSIGVKLLAVKEILEDFDLDLEEIPQVH